MGCVRKRGKSWNAQVRISGWRSFTKTFKTKLDATKWVFICYNCVRDIRSVSIRFVSNKNLSSII